MKKIIIGSIVSFILGGCSFSGETSNNPSNLESNNSSKSELIIIQNNKDLGEIPMDEGKVKIPFEFTNSGTGDVFLGNAETSCMCTEGIVTNMDGSNKSGTIKMNGHGAIVNLNRIVKPGETLLMLGIFDPNAHGPNVTGPISRDIFIETNSQITPKLDFKFIGNVTKTRTTPKIIEAEKSSSEQSLFQFKESSFDFGTIKQSGGKVQHDFEFTYNGTGAINITGVPTSCACTSASIDKTILQEGDTATLTVKFNPNLHEEPEGRFFKTVNILTDKKLSEIPEVKIWTQIDLDLGEEAFELKQDHKDDEKYDDKYEKEDISYHSITPAEFSEMETEKDFFLIDTHIPKQEHINGTDAFIPYNDIENNLEKLPKDKNTKIVLYCRSGSMSRAAAYILVEKGYTNVYDLVGGKIAYDTYQKK